MNNIRIDISGMTDREVDRIIKIQGTDYDRKRKVTSDILNEIIIMKNNGNNIHQIAKKLGLTDNAVKYNLDPEYRRKRLNKGGKHTGKTNMNSKNRIDYKKELILSLGV